MTLDLKPAEVACLISALGFESDRLHRLARAQPTPNFRRSMLLRAGTAHDLRERLRRTKGTTVAGHRVGPRFPAATKVREETGV